MAKLKTIFICQQCGATSPKWQGQCPNCQEWHTLVEELKEPKVSDKKAEATPTPLYQLPQILSTDHNRYSTHNQEFDRVLGGGIVPGSVTLIGGQPGIGKSTLLLQTVLKMATEFPILYFSGEESLSQIKMRATRLANSAQNQLQLGTDNNLHQIIASLKNQQPKLAIIDSIQTITSPDLSSPAGSVSQVRYCAEELTQLAKSLDIALFIVGHVTKEGEIAGPKVLEHIVDTVLALHGQDQNNFRILRANKNRYGDTTEIGLFKMDQQGLHAIVDATNLFIEEQQQPTPGSILSATSEGSRNLIIEIQALTVKTGFGYPKRATLGFPLTRLQLLLAVMSRHTRLKLWEHDVYVNIVGGYETKETTCDLAVCLAIASSFYNQSLPPSTLALGEVSLSGRLHPAPKTLEKIKEAKRLGLKNILLPQKSCDTIKRIEDAKIKNITTSISGGSRLADFIQKFF